MTAHTSTRTINISHLAEELNSMLHEYIADKGVFVPVNKNLIRYKNYSVIKNENGSWDTVLEDRLRYNTFLKLSAFTLCKLDETKYLSSIKEILDFDKKIEKYHTDSLHYHHIIKNSNDNIKQDVALWRYQDAIRYCNYYRKKIKRLFNTMIV